MEKSQALPQIDISFAPTNAFVKAHDEKTVNEQAEKFAAPSWASRVAPREKEEPKEKVPVAGVAVGEKGYSPEREALFVAGGLFVVGMLSGAFLLWRLGLLKTE